MAQKREKEETELKVPENLPLRTPTIPVSTPQSQLSGVAAASDDSRSNFARSPESSDPKLSGGTTADSVQLRSISISASPFVRSDLDKKESKNDLQSRPLKRPRDANRCSGLGCRRKLGLMGFHCRCGDIFCSEHRYSDRHDCTFDYKAVGREAIARENPVVKAAKILKV